MARLIDSAEVKVTVSYRTLGIVDKACLQDAHTPDAPKGLWIHVARGMAYLQCPSAVIWARVRLESWTTAPPPDAALWSGSEEADVELPSGVVGVFTIGGGWQEIAATLPSPGLYRLRLYWALNPEQAPFYSPLRDDRTVLQTPTGHEQELTGVDQFCLAQVWRLSATGCVSS